MSRFLRRLVQVASLTAVGLTAHTAVNLRRLRVPSNDPAPAGERVSVLLPVRDEAARVAGCLESLLEQIRVPDLEIVVLDDGSSDGTADVARAAAAHDSRVRVLAAPEPPPGWLGKPQRLPGPGRGGDRLGAGVRRRRRPARPDMPWPPRSNCCAAADLQLISPYPRQIALTGGERLVQPLLQWSWLTTLPLGLAERSPRPSLAAANGQFLVVDASTYRRSGGHAAEPVRGAVLDDVALVRSVKAAGGRGGMVDGTALATCRMYEDWPALRDGYTKSLWSAFGSPAGAAAVVSGLGLVYLVPPIAALGGSFTGLVGYLAAAGGRYVVAERTGGRSLPDSLAHPASIAVFGWLTAGSFIARRRGQLLWRGRPVAPARHENG